MNSHMCALAAQKGRLHKKETAEVAMSAPFGTIFKKKKSIVQCMGTVLLDSETVGLGEQLREKFQNCWNASSLWRFKLSKS